MLIEQLMLGTAVLLLASVIVSKASSRFGVPALLVFLVVGMLAGSDGPGGIHFDYPRAAQSLGIVALSLILFSGGLETRREDVRQVLAAGLLLSTLGVLMTAALVAVFAALVLHLRYTEALLLGSIVSCTDAAAVFGILRSKQLALPARLRPLLEFESGSNDPMAVFLTLGMIAVLTQPEFGAARMALLFVQQMAIGGAAGFLMGKLAVLAVNRLNLEYEGLYPALTVAMVFLTYGVAAMETGNGFLAVYVAAMVLGNSDYLHKRSLKRFHDGLAWLMQIAMFLTLGLQVFPSQLPSITVPALSVSLFLMFVARPAAVLLLLAKSAFNWRERALVAWVGLRGAAPIVLATFPLLAGISGSGMIFNVVFFIVLTSALLQGASVGWVAERLGVAAPSAESRVDPLDLIANGERDIIKAPVEPASAADGVRIVDAGLPPEALVLLVERQGAHIVPRGGTMLHAGDRVLVLAAKDQIQAVRRTLGAASS